MINPFHQEILRIIKENSGKATQHTFLDSYLGNSHPRYAISAPVLRTIAREWMRDHKNLAHEEFSALLTSLVEGESGTEKMFAGILMDYSTREQREFDPRVFDHWLDHLVGWAEIDAVCTGKYLITHMLPKWSTWKTLLTKFAKDKNINKRRASLVLLCSPVSQVKDPRLADMAIRNIEKLKHEKEVIITRAISWVLRSMIKHYPDTVRKYMKEQGDSLPKIAVRETMVKLKTGKKTKKASFYGSL